MIILVGCFVFIHLWTDREIIRWPMIGILHCRPCLHLRNAHTIIGNPPVDWFISHLSSILLPRIGTNSFSDDGRMNVSIDSLPITLKKKQKISAHWNNVLFFVSLVNLLKAFLSFFLFSLSFQSTIFSSDFLCLSFPLLKSFFLCFFLCFLFLYFVFLFTFWALKIVFSVYTT